MKLDSTHIIAALKNAGELLSEARILEKNGKLARTFTLIQLATEETAKALILLAAVCYDSIGKPLKSSNLNRLLRQHKAKILVANWFDDVMTGEPDGSPEDKNWRDLLVNHDFYNELKNNSLYVGVDDSPIEPSRLLSGESGAKLTGAYLSISESRHRVVGKLVEDSLERARKGEILQRDPRLASENHVSLEHSLMILVSTLINSRKR